MTVPDHLRVRREPKRGRYDRETIDAILDEALLCHLGFEVEGQPYVIPTLFARAGDMLYVHGSAASRMLEALAEGIDVCVTVTLVDGLVLARSAFHHSMNYRSVVVLGRARLVTDPEEKRAALVAVVEHVVPGRSRDVRDPSELELLATSVLRLDLLEVSAKVLRTGAARRRHPAPRGPGPRGRPPTPSRRGAAPDRAELPAPRPLATLSGRGQGVGVTDIPPPIAIRTNPMM